MKKKILLLTLVTTSIIQTTWCSQAPQPGYWQRFRSWANGIIEAPKVARVMRKIEIKIEDIPTTKAKLDALYAMKNSYDLTGENPDRIAYKAVGKAILYLLEKKTNTSISEIQNFKNLLERSTKLMEQTEGLSGEKLIKKLIQLHDDIYSPDGSHPNEAMFYYIEELLGQLLNLY